MVALPAEAAGEARARHHLLSVAGELWLLPPAARHLSGLAALRELFPVHSRGLGAGEADLAELGRAFESHLRIPGPKALLPYETSHLDPAERVRGPERLAAVAGLYRRAGYDLEPFPHVPADHMGHQLRFLGALSAREAEALERGDTAAAGNLRSWRHGFRREHVDVWVGRFCEHAARIDAHPFYRALARISMEVASYPPEGDAPG